MASLHGNHRAEKEIEKNWKDIVKRIAYKSFLCVRTDSICVLLCVVVHVIVCVCDDTYAWQIWGCLLEYICIAMIAV